MTTADRPELINVSQDTTKSRGYTPLQSLFMLRFKSLVEKRRQNAGLLPPSDWRMRLVDKALYSTYTDCHQVGLGEQAQELIRQARQAASS